MRWIRTPPDVVAAFDRVRPKDPRVVRKPMFGYPALFLNGNMFAGTFQDKVVARLSESGRARAAKTTGAVPFEPMPGRAMNEYVVLPAAVVGKPSALAKWIDEAHDYADTLPAKATRTAKRTPAAKPVKRTSARKARE